MPILRMRRRPRVGPPALNWDLAIGVCLVLGGFLRNLGATALRIKRRFIAELQREDKSIFPTSGVLRANFEDFRRLRSQKQAFRFGTVRPPMDASTPSGTQLPAERDQVPSLLRIIDLGSALDENGRSLCESHAHPSVKSTGDPGYVPCPYEASPSRFQHEKPMRQAALRQAQEHLDDLLWILHLMRRLHLSRVGHERPSIRDLQEICMMGEALPRFVRLAAHSKSSDHDLHSFEAFVFSGQVSVTFKSVRGIISIAHRILAQPRKMEKVALRDREKRGGDGSPAGQGAFEWDAKDLHAIAEDQGLFVGRGEVCAGTPSMIHQALKAIMEGRDRDTPPDHIQVLFADGDRFSRFTVLMNKLEFARQEFKARCRTALQTMQPARQSPGGMATSNKLFRANLKRLPGYLRGEQVFRKHLARTQTQVLQLFGHGAGGPDCNLAAFDGFIGPNPRTFMQSCGCQFSREGNEVVIRMPLRPGERELRIDLLD